MKPPSRNPSEYTKTIHAKQKLKYGLFSPYEVNTCIQNGDYIAVKGDKTAFTGSVSANGKEHIMRVIIAPSTKTIISMYCPCEEASMPDCHELDPNKYYIPD